MATPLSIGASGLGHDDVMMAAGQTVLAGAVFAPGRHDRARRLNSHHF